MEASPLRLVSPSHRNNTHTHKKINSYIKSPSHSHSHGPYQLKDTLLAYAKDMHSDLTKLTGFCNPFFFTIEMYNGTPTIAYHIRYNEQTSQNHINNITHQLPTSILTSSKKIPDPAVSISSKAIITSNQIYPKNIIKLHRISLIHFNLSTVIKYFVMNHLSQKYVTHQL